MRRWVLAAGFAAAALTGAPAAAERTGVSMQVPLACRATFIGSQQTTGDTVFLGTLREFCNSGLGYSVIIRHPQGMDGSSFLVEGADGVRRVPCSPDGETVLVRADHPGLATRQVSLELGGATAPAFVSVQMVSAG